MCYCLKNSSRKIIEKLLEERTFKEGSMKINKYMEWLNILQLKIKSPIYILDNV